VAQLSGRPALPTQSDWRSERGAELVEFALILPLLLLVLLGIMDFGLLFQRYEVITNAAREGARVAILPDYEASVDANVQARVNQYVSTSGLPGAATATVGAPQTVAVGTQCMTVRVVTVSYVYDYMFVGPIVGLFGGSSLTSKTLHASSAMRSEMAAAGCS
jgi:Flp pilus assembly protein TadG